MLAFGLLVPGQAMAGGFYLQEQSPKETGRAMAGGAAAADDPSIVYFNPAAMTQLDGLQLSTGAVALFATAGHSDRGSTRTLAGSAATVPVTGGSGGNPFAAIIPVPSAYATKQLGDRFWIGIGVTAPFGLKLDYDAGFFGRYDSLHTDLKTYNVQPSAAWKIGEGLSVGGGVDVQYVKVKLTNALPNLSPDSADGLAVVKGDDLTVGWNAGIFYTGGATNIGIHYRSGIRHHIRGSQTNSGLLGPIAAANGTSAASAPLALPDIVTASVTRKLSPTIRAMATARWYNWSVFREIAITSGTGTAVKAMRYHDSWSVSIGGEVDVDQRLTLRAGTRFDRTPTNSAFLTTRVPDGDRKWLSAGATWAVTDHMALNLSYAHNFVDKADLVRTDHYYGLVTTTTRSRVSGNADQLAASLSARF